MNNLLTYFENTAAHFPDKTAVACRDESYTFAQLKDLSQRMGSSIAEYQPESGPVGVLVDRGADTAAFFLAALYSGNFYIPIDPDMPGEKIDMILNDADIRMMLCDTSRVDFLRDLGYGGQILTTADAGETKTNAPTVSSDTPACMLYTSGSTGVPKGVLKSHGAFIDFMENYIDLFNLGAEEIIGNQTPFFFDAAAKDFYLMVFTGATLEVLPSELFLFPVTLIEYMNQKKISYICWVPSALSIVTQLRTFQEILPTTLKKVFFVGETFPVKHLREWMRVMPKLTYVNLYGSTEIAGVCCYYNLPVPFDEDVDEIPVGCALPNCRVFLRGEDEENFITGPDEVGEICVASNSLALEYYHDPKRTNETFVTLPLPDGTSARALRTGDLAKYDEAGNLVFVSRSDDQIKHMGHRIELGEIESVANRIPEIQKCCCLYNKKKDQICLFVELVPGCGWDAKTIRRTLKGKLSDYMQPSKCFVLDAIPQNANGKADRAGLREYIS